ncbi:MAG: chromosome segregation protein SMC [Myxococcota bacterium]
MRLKSLELHGFKSFVDKTVLQFKPGITGVVGPNGCGKSNVVDAMRWVMGEQAPRRLRGKGMEDVIFAGSEGRAPVGMAEVTLSFDNSQGTAPPAFAAYQEIQITRRLFRSGDSEYLMNRTPCRLRDVQDFFRDTGIGTKGYTIVEQGKIAEIVSQKAEERRLLIEEAAGIGKYKARRREAESKISSTEQNLLRVNDVLTEIKRQISSIERQARKAARYKRLRETLRVLELSLASDDRRELVTAMEEAQGGLQQRRDAVTAFETQLAERELGVQQKRLELGECEQVLTQGSESLLALRGEIKECEGQIEYGRRERESLAELVEARRTELSELGEQRATHDRELAQLDAELAAVEQAVESGAASLAEAEGSVRTARGGQQELERERETANTALVGVLTAIARGEDRLAYVEDRTAELESRLRSADEVLEVGQGEASRADTEQHRLEEGLRNLLAERDRMMGAVRNALDTHAKAVETERQTDGALRTLREESEAKRARLTSLREVLERGDDVAAGTRHLLERDEGTRTRLGLRGLVRDFLEADREIERAVEAALADRAEAVVVDTPTGALSALEMLRESRAGRAVFVAQRAAGAEPAGFVPMGTALLDQVRPRSGSEDLVRALLTGVYLVDDLAEPLRVYGQGRIPATFVTAEGDLLAPDGVVRGGAGGVGGHLARTREVRELDAEVTRLETDVAAAASAHHAAREALATASDELENLRNRHHTAALAVANHEKDLERTRERVKAIGEVQEGRVSERSELLAELESLRDEGTRLTRTLEDTRNDRGERQRALDALALKLGSSAREVSRLEGVATERRVEHSGRAEQRDRLRGSRERTLASLTEARTWIQRRETEIGEADARREQLATTIEAARGKLEGSLQQEERARAGHDEKREAFERVSGEVQELEETVRELRAEIAREREALSQAELGLRESELKLSHLDESIQEKWGVALATWEPPVADPEPEGEAPTEPTSEVAPMPAPADATAPAEAANPEAGAEAEEPSPDAAKDARANALLAQAPAAERREKLTEVRKKLQSLGEVNLGAIEEHEELNERFRFLSDQKTDLENTLTSLRDAIARINRTSRRRFRETFEAISKRFSENFPRLFRGGRASLALTDSEDVLEAGIDIMAMPPGKRLQNVNLLSGGEKTLTAIALLVAVFQVRPSPFFLLDEVDAALDDANVGRFNEIVTELSADSQFVLITHNKRTIEVSDVLYGVTMERKGVSKLVAVEMH